MKIILGFLILLNITLTVQAQIITPERAEKFLEFALFGKHSEEDFVEAGELKKSRRFGIKYDETDIKYLIAYNIPDELKPKVRSGELKYSYSIIPLENNFSRLELNIPEYNHTVKFYFKGDYLVSPSLYFSKDWKTTESRFFKFIISTPGLFNAYTAEVLDNFILKMSKLMELPEDDLALLEKEKIYYYFCKDETEIEKLSGFKTLGIYNLASDLIITTYNCHYHEICHLLMNFKIKNVPLYTHPLLQEGFAVAYGGRGGREPEIMMNVGNFLLSSGIMSLNNLMTKDDFLTEDASMTYPVAGILTRYFVENTGFGKYLDLYKKFSSGRENINKIVFPESELPEKNAFTLYLKKLSDGYSSAVDLKFSREDEISTPCILSDEEGYIFFIKDKLKIFSSDVYPDYISKKYDEIFEDKKFEGEKYIVRANDNEISIYNLFSNNLIFNYAISFSINQTPIRKNKHGLYFFRTGKDIFDEDISTLSVKY